MSRPSSCNWVIPTYYIFLSYPFGELGWYRYAQRESESLPDAFNAFGYAVSHELTDKRMTVSLIKNIHEKVTRSLGIRDRFSPGCFREHPSMFLLRSMNHDGGYCNDNGLQELIHFVDNHTGQSAALLYLEIAPEASEYERITLQYIAAKVGIDASSSISYRKLSDDYDKWYFRPPSAEALSSLVELVCTHYNTAIAAAVNDEAKLCVIVSHIQRLERIHPFIDGNGRTSYILMQRLLIQNGFLPTIMELPNHLDGFDLDSVVAEVKQGMLYTQLLIHYPSITVLGYKTKQLSTTNFFGDYSSTTIYDEISAEFVKSQRTIERFYQSEEALSNLIQTISPNIKEDEDETYSPRK